MLQRLEHGSLRRVRLCARAKTGGKDEGLSIAFLRVQGRQVVGNGYRRVRPQDGPPFAGAGDDALLVQGAQRPTRGAAWCRPSPPGPDG
jgi:hypothetical protein